MTLLPVAEAQARLLSLGTPVTIEERSLAAAAGCWLARPVTALTDRPFADLSAMDGYALRFADLPGPLALTGESAAGADAPAAIGPGQAMRIFTGAPMPPGADSVLVQEEAGVADGVLTLAGEGPPARGAHVRAHASDFRSGQTLLPAGHALTPAAIGLLASAGHGSLPVRRRVRVAIVSTGRELVPPGAPIGPGRLPGSNAPMLAGLLAGPAVTVDDRGIVGDDLADITAAVAAAAAVADIVVTSGGASVGDHDLVRSAILAAGGTIDFWRIAMRPGKPLMAGRVGDAVVIGLPGNPVSALVTALLFARPLAHHLAGAADPLPRTGRAPLARALPANGARQDYVRSAFDGGALLSAVAQDSGHLSILAHADALIVRAPHAPAAAAGDMVDYLRLR